MSGKNKVKLRSLLTLHRTLGLLSALFVLLLSSTGLLLQHTTLLRLDNRFLGSDIWLKLYGLEVPPVTAAFTSGNHTVALLADSLYFDLRHVADNVRGLSGLVGYQSNYLAATDSQLMLFTESGETVEVLSAVHGIPQPLERLGQLDTGDLVLSSQGRSYRASLDRLEFEILGDPDGARIEWSQPATFSEQQSAQLAGVYGDRMINLERLVLDIHSGRIVGNWGVVLMDLMALLFMIMAISGLWIWSRRRSAKGGRQANRKNP